MSSLIANQVIKQIYVLVSVKLFIVLTTFVPLFTLNWYNTNYNNNCLPATTIRHSAHSRNCLVRSSHATWHKTAYITTDCYPLYLPLLYTYVFRLQNGLNVEGSWSCLLEISNAKACVCAFSYQLFPHTYCCWFRCSMYLLGCICVHITVRLCCVCVIHLSHTHTNVIVGLLINSSMYIYMFLFGFCFIIFMRTIIGRLA